MTIANASEQIVYANRIVTMHKNGEHNAYKAFKSLAQSLGQDQSCYDQKPSEDPLQYVHRCACHDYEDGCVGGALFQEVYDVMQTDAVSTSN